MKLSIKTTVQIHKTKNNSDNSKPSILYQQLNRTGTRLVKIYLRIKTKERDLEQGRIKRCITNYNITGCHPYLGEVMIDGRRRTEKICNVWLQDKKCIYAFGSTLTRSSSHLNKWKMKITFWLNLLQ